jgi:hypothetical protein
VHKIFIRHEVTDYADWRPHYDDDRPRRQQAGVRDVAVYRNAIEPNDVLLVWEADRVEGVEEMIGSEGLAAKMREAGVIGAPEVWHATED